MNEDRVKEIESMIDDLMDKTLKTEEYINGNCTVLIGHISDYTFNEYGETADIEVKNDTDVDYFTLSVEAIEDLYRKGKCSDSENNYGDLYIKLN